MKAWVNYDKRNDSLTVLWEMNQPAASRDVGGQFWLRDPDGKIIGVEIEDFRKRFMDKVA